MARSTYFTLCVVDGSPGCKWSPEFGDYDWDTVKDEYDDYRDRGWKAKELKIVASRGTQAAIDDAVAHLNKDL